MSKFKVISKDSTSIRYEGAPQYSGTYLGVDYIEFKNISSPVVIDWQIGDYVDYFRTGVRYKLYAIPMPKKVARVGSYGGAIEYSNVQFFAPTKELEIAPFRDLVLNENGIHFSTRQDVSTYEDVRGIARRIQACMDDLFPKKWRIEVYETDDEELNNQLAEVKEFGVSQSTCLDALSQIYDTWKGIGWMHYTDKDNDQEVIVIGRANVRDADNTTDLFTYGIGNGLTSIRKNSANEGEFATRLYIYGSERNLQPRYYNQFDIVNKESVDIRNLMIPISEWGLTDGVPDAKKAYLQADDALIEKYGLIPKTLYFNGTEREEIYPTIVGITEGKVREYMIKDGLEGSPLLPPDTNDRIDKALWIEFTDDKGAEEDIKANPNFSFWVRGVGFDIAEQGKKTSEGHATISMKSGMCAGRNFVVKKSRMVGYSQELTLERAWDESLGMGFPNNIYPIEAGEEFVLLDIPMPDYYISIAEDRLLEQGKKMLADYTRVSAFYEPGIDAIRMKKVGGVVTPGMYMQVMDEDIIDTEDHTDYVLIDSLSIDEITEIPTYKITLREEKRAARTYSTLEDMIEDAKEDANKAIKREREYTDRRFRSSQETLEMLEAAFSNFSKGITPATVKTMALLIGDESLQYKFTASRDSLVDVPCPLSWNPETKQMIGVPASLIHMTLDIEGIAPTGARGASDYKSWNIISWWDKDTFQSPFVEDAEKSYYVYVRASKESTDAWYYIDENSHSMIDDDYYFLVGILNSEYDSNRDFVTLYGFTEVLPGQITTDVIRSADGKTYFDLLRGEISGDIHFIAPDGSDKSITDYAQEQNEQFSLIDKDVKNLQDQIDGVVENHFYEGTPTTSNYPAVEWTSDIQKIIHIGDTYTDIEEFVDSQTTPNAGKSWRWCRCDDMTGITDYVEATDKDGVTYKLHWHPIADTDAVKALLKLYELKRKVDDAEYLKETFKKGETNISGGVVMTEMVAVGEGGDNIEAFLNGSDFARIPNHYGKLILASGIPDTTTSGSTDLAERAKEARTRLYENGVLESNWAIIDNGWLGPFVVDQRKFKVNSTYSNSDKTMLVLAQGTSSNKNSGIAFRNESSDTKVNVSIGSRTGQTQYDYLNEDKSKNGTMTLQFRLGLSSEVESNGSEYYDYLSAFYVSCKGTRAKEHFSIHCPNGQFAGLRPRFRRITSSDNLSPLDHTIECFRTDGGNVWLALPADPEIGQCYEIWKWGSCTVVINGRTKNIVRIGVVEQLEHGIDNTFTGVIKLVYRGGNWLMTLHRTE